MLGLSYHDLGIRIYWGFRTRVTLNLKQKGFLVIVTYVSFLNGNPEKLALDALLARLAHRHVPFAMGV